MTELFVNCEFVLQTQELTFEVRQAHGVYHWVLKEKRTEGRKFASFPSPAFASPAFPPPAFPSCKDAIDDFCYWYSRCVEDLDSNMHREFEKLVRNIFIDTNECQESQD